MKEVLRLARKVDAADDGARLDEVVRRWLASELRRAISKAAVRKLLMAGAVRVDGVPARRPGLLISNGSRLQASVDLSRLAPPREAAAFPPISLLYEDDVLVAVAKPAGLVTHATADANRPNLFDRVRLMLATRPGLDRALPYLGLHHRLDVDTSGVVIFTKDRAANASLAQQFAEGQVRKIYHAIACGRLDKVRRKGESAPEWRVENRLALVGSGRRARVQEVKEGGARAVTEFRVVELFTSAVLVEARPGTGRKHQIRAHLADMGLPILGDGRYLGPMRAGSCEVARTMLHAWRLQLRHPVTARPLTVTCPYPADFAGALACLGRP